MCPFANEHNNIFIMLVIFKEIYLKSYYRGF